MREIKFRAWDKEREEMRQIQLMDWSAWWVSTGSTWERGNTLEYGERNSFKNEETDRHILMQYTGLKDKNGKDIYEGDIVTGGRLQCADGFAIKNEHSTVTFESGIFKAGKMSLNSINRACEVIGNVWENHLEVTP